MDKTAFIKSSENLQLLIMLKYSVMLEGVSIKYFNIRKFAIINNVKIFCHVRIRITPSNPLYTQNFTMV